MEPLVPQLAEVTERLHQLNRLCKTEEEAPVNRWIADGVKKQLDLLTYNANLYSLLVEELKKSDGCAEINKVLVKNFESLLIFHVATRWSSSFGPVDLERKFGRISCKHRKGAGDCERSMRGAIAVVCGSRSNVCRLL